MAILRPSLTSFNGATFRIDLADVHPDHPGRYVLGIECDGATYHSSATARDRDRLRQEALEGLGWTFCRIWSTDWVRNPDRQIDRVLVAYNEALASSDSLSAGSSHNSNEESSNEDPEEPVLLKLNRRSSQRTTYASIDVVPEDVIQEAVVEILRQCGRTTGDDLIKAVARQLGFQRTGHKIQKRIGTIIKHLAKQQQVNWVDGDSITAS